MSTYRLPNCDLKSRNERATGNGYEIVTLTETGRWSLVFALAGSWALINSWISCSTLPRRNRYAREGWRSRDLV